MNKKNIKKITVKQIKSLIGKTSKQKSSLKGLGLKRINHKVVLEDTPEVQGMIKVVKHMIEIEN
ncbi:MAG: 50S ribosomal protein L30 [Pseudomonadota bacterium]|nr:50S ribosomal protein L30 [Pseudomonadota bacterium]MED5430040.1 50S ribosomal protein L30 [Pseudomonadota bacterium]